MAQRTEEWHLPVFRQGKRHESWLDFSIFDKYGNVWSQFHAVMYNSQLKYNSLLNLIHTQSNNILSSKTKKKMYWQKIYKWWFPWLLIYFYSNWIHFYLILDKNIGGFYNFYSILYLHSVLIFTSDGDDVAGPWSFSVLTVIRYSVALSKPTI